MYDDSESFDLFVKFQAESDYFISLNMPKTMRLINTDLEQYERSDIERAIKAVGKKAYSWKLISSWLESNCTSKQSKKKFEDDVDMLVERMINAR